MLTIPADVDRVDQNKFAKWRLSIKEKMAHFLKSHKTSPK
jgi:hypothetical protein